jgi:hypothetical protein
MQQAIVSTLPFLGQIVKITTRDGKEYDVKISEELPDNDRVFSIMFRNSASGANVSGGNYRNNTNTSNVKPPERPELPAHLRPQVNNQDTQIKNKKYKVNKKVDCTKVGSSININDIVEQPFKLNF